MTECVVCLNPINPKRAALGYASCITCGDRLATRQRAGWCIAPIAHKQGATLVTDPEQLKGLNKYAGE